MIAGKPDDDTFEPAPFTPSQVSPGEGDSLVLHLRLGADVIGVVYVSLPTAKEPGSELWRLSKAKAGAWHAASSCALVTAAVASVDGAAAVADARAVALGAAWGWSDPCLVAWKASPVVAASAALFRFQPMGSSTTLVAPAGKLWLAVTPVSGGAPRVDWYGADEAVSGPYGYKLPAVAPFVRVSGAAGITRQFDRG